MMILVTGATGNAGGAVVRALVEHGADVRALVRDAEVAGLPSSVNVVTGDLNKPETVRPHLDGVSAAFLLSGYDGLAQTLADMRSAGVARVVLLSSSAAPGGDLSNAVARYHILSEQAVRDSGLAWTFLQPNSLMSNTFRWLPQLQKGDVIHDAFGHVAVAMIDPADLAAVSVKALVTDELEAQSLRLSGPEAIYPADRVRVLSEALDRELRFEPWSNEQARTEMAASMPTAYVDAFFSFFVDGTIDETTVLPTVREVLGRDPRSFEQWVTANIDSLRSPPG
jgi:uncharacterized protein YbjT (DUF2867 family)